MIMQIKYKADNTLPGIINIFNADTAVIPFHDDGVAPDDVAGDFIYSVI